MASETTKKQITSEVKSPTNSISGSYLKILGGMPPKKSVDEINKENTPKKAPQSVGN